MKLALYQGKSPNGDVAAAFETIRRMLGGAAASGAEMLLFPELFLPGYNQAPLHHSLAQPAGGPWEQALGDLAASAGCGITIGWAESASGVVYNAASTFDASGRKIAHYRKIQLYGPIERATFAPGDSYTLFDLNGIRTALLICYDVEFAQHCHELRRQGAELLLVPTANPSAFPFVSQAMVPARAVENGLTIAYANYCGEEGDLGYGGKSLIVGPDAKPLVQAGQSETLLVVDLNDNSAIDPAILSTQHLDFRKIGTAK